MQHQPTDLRVLGYTRVSTGEQEESGAGLDAQETSLIAAADFRRWELLEVVRDMGSGKDLDRQALYALLERLARGEADALAVAKLDRLTRSLVDFAMLLQWFEDAGVALIALDFELDTSTPTGELIAHIIMAVAQWERRAIGQRTSDALAAIRAQGLPTNQGNVSDVADVAGFIKEMRDNGATLRGICEVLNREAVPTIRGAQRWRPSALQTILGYQRPRRRRQPAHLPELT
jgi:DNA invertase Pin-like site-specific DNA recombinase